MGHFCRICKKERANERFSGKGHARHVCRDCERLPRAEREYVEIMDELYGYLNQRNISEKNVVRLNTLVKHPHSDIRDRARVLLELAAVCPRKRRRFKFLARNRRDLLLEINRVFDEFYWFAPEGFEHSDYDLDTFEESGDFTSQREFNDPDDDIPF